MLLKLYLDVYCSLLFPKYSFTIKSFSKITYRNFFLFRTAIQMRLWAAAILFRLGTLSCDFAVVIVLQVSNRTSQTKFVCRQQRRQKLLKRQATSEYLSVETDSTLNDELNVLLRLRYFIWPLISAPFTTTWTKLNHSIVFFWRHHFSLISLNRDRYRKASSHLIGEY